MNTKYAIAFKIGPF